MIKVWIASSCLLAMTAGARRESEGLNMNNPQSLRFIGGYSH